MGSWNAVNAQAEQTAPFRGERKAPPLVDNLDDETSDFYASMSGFRRLLSSEFRLLALIRFDVPYQFLCLNFIIRAEWSSSFFKLRSLGERILRSIESRQPFFLNFAD